MWDVDVDDDDDDDDDDDGLMATSPRGAWSSRPEEKEVAEATAAAEVTSDLMEETSARAI